MNGMASKSCDDLCVISCVTCMSISWSKEEAHVRTWRWRWIGSVVLQSGGPCVVRCGLFFLGGLRPCRAARVDVSIWLSDILIVRFVVAWSGRLDRVTLLICLVWISSYSHAWFVSKILSAHFFFSIPPTLGATAHKREINPQASPYSALHHEKNGVTFRTGLSKVNLSTEAQNFSIDFMISQLNNAR